MVDVDGAARGYMTVRVKGIGIGIHTPLVFDDPLRAAFHDDLELKYSAFRPGAVHFHVQHPEIRAVAATRGLVSI